jgi:predicted GIY-YIG superfamily endonuclease
LPYSTGAYVQAADKLYEFALMLLALLMVEQQVQFDAAMDQMSTAIQQSVADIQLHFANEANVRATAIAYVNAILNNQTRFDNQFGNSVYILVDKALDVHYVGRTNDPRRREREHKSFLSTKKNYDMTVVMTGLDKNSARAWEQILISAYTLDALDNARREIAVANVGKFATEFNRAVEIMGSGVNLSTAAEDMADLIK